MGFFDIIEDAWNELTKPMKGETNRIDKSILDRSETEITCPKCRKSKLRNSGIGIINLYCPKCDYRFNGDDNNRGSSASGLLIQ